MSQSDKSSYTISEAFQSYLKTNSPKKTASSQKIDRRTLAIAQWFFENSLGLTLMADVGVEALEQFEIFASEPQQCGSIHKESWSTSSIMRHGKTLKAIFRKAFLTGRIARNPAELWKLASGDPAERRRPMTDQEFETLLSIAPDWFKTILKVLGATGARGSSVARLRWTDVDMTAGVLYFTSRKGAAKREKRIPFPIYEQLKDILTSVAPISDFVFTKDGFPVSGPLISITGHRLIKAAGFRGVVLYGLRHKFATDLLRNGTSTEIARRLMGHSNEAMLKIYSSQLGIEALDQAVTSIRGKK